MRIAPLLLTLALVAPTFGQPKPHTTAELLLSLETARPGQTVLAGVRLRMEKGWHTYWKNAGESGAATEIQWQLPPGITAGEIQWPAPEKYVAEGLTTFVLHDEAVLVVPLQLAADLAPGPLTVKAGVSWLECQEMCIPGDAQVSAVLTIGEVDRPSRQAAVLEAARARLPRAGELAASAAWLTARPDTNAVRRVALRWPDAARATEAAFFPHAGDGFEVLPETAALEDGSGLAVRVQSQPGQWPARLEGVLVFKREGQTEAHAIAAEIAPGGGASTAGTDAAPGAFPPPGMLLLHLLAALVGGVILNLMPCVLPILSLKVLSLVRAGGQSAAEARRHSLVYLLGVVVSFWAVAGLVIAGRLATWGAQFQDARFVVFITILLVLIALNLFGVFELLLPGGAANKAAELAGRGGASGAFFNGVLAVVLGASCVAPLMAAAIGWAVSQPPLVIVLVFTALGLGLALPYLVMAFVPAARALLPRPGAWMEKFKTAMGFPMLATAAWTFSLAVDHYGGAGVLWLGLALVLFALGAWIYGEFVQRGTRRKGVAAGLALLCLAAGYGFALERQLDWRHPNYGHRAALAGPTNGGEGIAWQPWSAAAVAAARAEGRPVFVDFTAKWCLTCKANLASSIEIEAVRRKLREINAVSLLGDFTLKDPAIAEELKKFGRAGVPLVLVYPRDASRPPEVLPTLLTPGIVLDALDRAAR